MNHEYRERADCPGRCAACGLLFARCRGSKPFDLSFLSNRPEFSPSLGDTLRARAAAYRDAAEPAPIVANSWEAWCRQFGVDPDTKDEGRFDDFLHGRRPQGLLVGDNIRLRATGGTGEPRERRRRLTWRTDAQREFYAGWDAYDAAFARMPKVTRDLQDRAERVELERAWAL